MKQITSADEMPFFKLESNLDMFSIQIYISELSKHCTISIYDKIKKSKPCSTTINKFVLMFSPVLVGSTGGSKIGLDSLVFNLLSKSTLSSTILLLDSFIISFFTSSSCEFVLTTISLTCSSGILVFSLSVGKVGAS